jgi:hypothetical protein
MNSFLISDNCPNLLKADVEKAKQNFNVDNLDDPVENQFFILVISTFGMSKSVSSVLM